MKVRTLIEQLKQLDPEMEVVKSYDYGDHWHTTVCPFVEYPEEMEIMYSAYHGMNKLVESENADDGSERTDSFTEMVVVL